MRLKLGVLELESGNAITGYDDIVEIDESGDVVAQTSQAIDDYRVWLVDSGSFEIDQFGDLVTTHDSREFVGIYTVPV